MRLNYSLILFLFIALNVLWYYIKYVVRQHGCGVQWFWGHLSEIRDLHKIVRNEEDVRKKVRLKVLLYSFYGLLILTLVSVVPLFILGI
jgi:hypothetical protein